MKQARRFIALVLVVLLAACSNGKQGSNTSGINRIRATALAAQQREAEQPTPPPAPVEIVVQPTQPPIEQAQPAPASGAHFVQADVDRLEFGVALLIILAAFFLGCVVGSVTTTYWLGPKEVKREPATR